MNVEMLRKLARRMRRLRHEEHYDQREWGLKTDCGTAACLAGQAVIMVDRKLPAERDDDSKKWLIDTWTIRQRAVAILDIGWDEAESLFSHEPDRRWASPFAQRWAMRAKKRGKKNKHLWPSQIAADYLDYLADLAAGQEKQVAQP